MLANSNSRGLAALMAVVGLAATAPFAGCGGDDSVTVNPTASGGNGGEAGAGGEGGAGGTAGAGGAMSVCGNGVVEGLEACDDGNMMSGDGCEGDCNFTCSNKSPVTGDAKCDDADPCNGAETCQDNHTCLAGTRAPDGTACANGQICITGVCSPTQCGDLYVDTATEECEDGNTANGDGCNNCQFTCLSTDPARDCKSEDPCVATACDDSTHTCGMPIGDGLTCTPGSVCKMGVCTPTVCGDGNLEAGEICDDGNLLDGDGCDADCTRSCINPATDCPAAPVCQAAACDTNFVCITNNIASDPACMAPNTCQSGACQAPAAVCGNGILEMGETCDFGMANGPNAGCETNCTYSCTMDADCIDMNTCNGTEACSNVMVNGQTGRQCTAGTNQMDCSTCTGGLCKAGVCTASVCGDGCIDAAASETCEPPNTMTCDAMCKTITIAVCGNGTREMGEQCDDNNTTNLDGCNAFCKFEQIQRVNWILMQYATDTYCTANQLGSAIASAGQSTISQALTDGVNNGSISIMLQMLGLDDLSGTNSPGFEIGSLNGAPFAAPSGVTYNGASDLDWWYTVGASSLTSARLPIYKLNASIAAKALSAGPGPLQLNVTFGTSPANLKMSSARISALVNNVSTPTTSMMSVTPGHLPSENVDPALQTFTSMAQATSNGGGKLCGNVSAESLNQVPVPTVLLPGGSFACNQAYSTANTLLDVIVGGCTVTVIIPIAVVNARQPDQQDPLTPDAGTGGPYMLTRDMMTKRVTGCRDRNNNAVNLTQCLADAAYSAYFKFATDRVIGR